MPALEPDLFRPGRAPAVAGSDEAVVDAFAANMDLDRERMRRMVMRAPEQLDDADLCDLGCTREEALDVAREIRRGLRPAYLRVVSGRSRGVGSSSVRRVGTRARGAGRPAARRAGGASSSSASGDDGSGSADPEPSSRPARRWALYSQARPAGGSQRAVILALLAGSAGRADR